ncbi:hypothetical protein BDW67DRAFT_2863 [Aspergillus spinulosporus]
MRVLLHELVSATLTLERAVQVQSCYGLAQYLNHILINKASAKGDFRLASIGWVQSSTVWHSPITLNSHTHRANTVAIYEMPSFKSHPERRIILLSPYSLLLSIPIYAGTPRQVTCPTSTCCMAKFCISMGRCARTPSLNSLPTFNLSSFRCGGVIAEDTILKWETTNQSQDLAAAWVRFIRQLKGRDMALQDNGRCAAGVVQGVYCLSLA